MAKNKRAPATEAVHTVTVEISQETLDAYLNNFIEHLCDYNPDHDSLSDVETALEDFGLTVDGLKSDPRFIAKFRETAELMVRDSARYIDIRDGDLAYTKTVFKKEIAASTKAKTSRLKAEIMADRAKAERLKNEGVAIIVTADKAEQAQAVLRAAGLL